MNGKRRLAGAGLEGNQAGRSNLRKAGKPKRGENQSGNIMFSGKFIRAHPGLSIAGQTAYTTGDW